MKRKRVVVTFLGLLVLILAGVGYLCLVKPQMVQKQEKESLQASLEAMMDAYSEKNLSQALSHTDLKAYSEGIGSYIEASNLLDQTTLSVLQISDNWEDNMEALILNVVRSYDIKEIVVDGDEADIRVKVTIPDLSGGMDLEEFGMGDAANVLASALGDVDWFSQIVDIVGDLSIGSIVKGLGSIGGEAAGNTIDEMWPYIINEMACAEDKKISLKLPAHKEGDDWIIEIEDILREMDSYL